MDQESRASEEYQFAADSAAFHEQPSKAHWQFEALAAGAAGVEVEDSVSLFLLGDMAVARDHYVESRSFGLQIQLRQIVQHEDGNAGRFEDFSFRQLKRPSGLVHIAADSGYGRDGS